MDTITIASVKCRVDKMANLNYEQLMSMALKSKEFRGKKNAESLIDKELRGNGFKPSITNSVENKADNSIKNPEPSKKRNTRKPKRDSREGSRQVEKGG